MKSVLPEQFVANGRRDRDDAIGRAGKHALDANEERRLHGAEISLEDMPVVRVNDARAFPGRRT